MRISYGKQFWLLDMSILIKNNRKNIRNFISSKCSRRKLTVKIILSFYKTK